MANFANRSYASDCLATRNVSLTAEQDAFVKEVVDAGEYQNASEAVRDALRLLRQHRQEQRLKLRALSSQIRTGIAALEHGDYVEMDDRALQRFLLKKR